MKELPLSMNIVMGKEIAQAEVRWELHSKAATRRARTFSPWQSPGRLAHRGAGVGKRD